MTVNDRKREAMESGNVAGQIWTCTTCVSTTVCWRVGTDLLVLAVFDLFFQCRKGNSLSKNRGLTNTFPHVTLSKLKEGPVQNCSFLVWTASSTQVLCGLMREPQRDVELPETRALCVKPSCHLPVPEITVSNLLYWVALISMLSPKALFWVMDVTWCSLGANSKDMKKYLSRLWPCAQKKSCVHFTKRM